MAQGRVAVFDGHLHVIDPRFPLVANQGYLPVPFPVDDYRAATAGVDVVGDAVVSGSFQAFDQTYLVDALELVASIAPAALADNARAWYRPRA